MASVSVGAVRGRRAPFNPRPTGNPLFGETLKNGLLGINIPRSHIGGGVSTTCPIQGFGRISPERIAGEDDGRDGPARRHDRPEHAANDEPGKLAYREEKHSYRAKCGQEWRAGSPIVALRACGRLPSEAGEIHPGGADPGGTGADQQPQAPPQQPPPPPEDGADGIAPPRPVTATVDRSLTVSACP